MIDAYSVFCAVSTVLTALFCIVAGTTFPFNSLLAALWTSIGAFAFAFSLRMQVVAPDEFGGRKTQRAFQEFLLCNAILFLAAWNYIG